MAIDTPARIAIVGAGPIGLEAALYARYLGYDVDIYERGRVGEHLLRSGHAKMFTPFGDNRSPLALAALSAQNESWTPPDDSRTLDWRHYVEQYLRPLAESDLLSDGLHPHTEVIAIGRDELRKHEGADDEERGDCMFRLLLRSAKPGETPHERVAEADIVIDASGVMGQHNWLGQGGIPAIGELAANASIEHGLVDVFGRDHARYAGRHTLVVGCGDSAATNIIALAELAAQSPDTWITWLARHEFCAERPGAALQRGHDPAAPQARLARAANALAADDANHITLIGGAWVDTITWHHDLQKFAVRLAGAQTDELEVDRVIANVGYRPQANFYRELRVAHCPTTEAPLNLASALASGEPTEPDPASLITGEPNFYILGAKSYGRAPNFTFAAGLRQIRDLFTIIGDRASLDIYATMPKLS